MPRRTPTRREIDATRGTLIKPGGPSKADLRLVDLGDGPLVIKDFGTRAAWVRVLGRIQIAREAAAYRWLEGLDCVPRFVGRVDAWALAIEHVDGQQLADVYEGRADRPALLARLQRAMEAIHARGLYHLDLRGRENILVTTAGDVLLLDFAGALWARPGSLGHRLIAKVAGATDRSAFLKWKDRLTPGSFTAEEEVFIRRFQRRRRWWIFNPKGKGQAAP